MPFPVARDDWTLIQGEPVSRLYNFENSLGGAFDLTGFTVACQFRQAPPDLGVLLTPTLEIIAPATNGQVLLTVSPADTFKLSGILVFDIVATDSTGVNVLRLISGEIRVSPAVTRT